MNLELPELQEINDKLTLLLTLKPEPFAAWYSLRQAWVLKGGPAWNTFRQKKWLQPLGGRYESYQGNVGVFSRETIIEWLAVTDDTQERYHSQHKTGVRVPALRSMA